jgi:hypothetical protein
VRSVFESVFDSTSPEHSLIVAEHLLEVVDTVLEELEEDKVTQPIVDTILENLVEPKKTERPASYDSRPLLLRHSARWAHDGGHFSTGTRWRVR